MAGITLNPLQLNPRNLQDINGMDPTWAPYVWQWQDRAGAMDQASLDDVMRQAAHEKQMDPLRIQEKEATIQNLYATGEQTRANTIEQQMKNEIAAHTLPQTKELAVKKALAEASVEDLKKLESDVYTNLKSPDPKTRQAAMTLLPYMKFAVEEKIKADQQLRVQGSANAAAMARQKQQQEHQIELEKMRVGRALRVAEINAAARKAASAAKSPKDWEALAAALAQEMLSEKDPEAKAALVQQIEYAQMMAERLKNMPPQINPGVVGNGKLIDPKTAPMPAAPGLGPKPGTRENPIKLD